ncbi:hypothetical protein BJ944DRAFT_274173 [Cunninghamella echinulata]|nr:hypothetical protein BJ944DRAFT_274173 [Cunninghamella echinulata]
MTYNEKDNYYNTQSNYDTPTAPIQSPPPPPPPHQYNNEPLKGYATPPPSQYTPSHGYPTSPFDPNHTNNNHMNNHSPYNNYHNESKKSFDDPNLYHQIPIMGGYHNPRESMSDKNLTAHVYDSDDEENYPNTIPKEKRKRSCMDKLCCGCCTCCPKWVRYCSCILLLILIALGIAVGVLAALFKIPKVNMSGLDSPPSVNVTDTTIHMGFQLQVSVDNPNVEGITFEQIIAKAYYPQHRDVQLGGGEKDQVVIAKQQTSNFTFPFDLTLDMSNPSYQSITNDLFDKCGLFGAPKQKITIDYDVIPTVKFGLIPISITIPGSTSFDCPDVLQHLSSIANVAGSKIGGGAAASLTGA